MPFKDNNAAVGLSKSNPFQVGISNKDTDKVLEAGLGVPWIPDPAGSYMWYDCTVGVMLDSGMAVHSRLPQVNNTIDTLASVAIDAQNIDQITNIGVNLRSNDQYTDIIQRMGHSRYWFRLWGSAIRVGYRVPIPGIKTIGGVTAVPYDKNPQWAFNKIVPGANFGGVPLWAAKWSLWYTTLTPPLNQTIPLVDPSAHLEQSTPLPDLVQAPFSQPDDSARTSAPGGLGATVGRR